MVHVIITPPPTPNGGLHVGHVAGPYLRADLNTRLLRMFGAQAVHASHIDNYQTYVKRKADEKQRDVEEFRLDMIAAIERDYAALDMEFGSRIDNTAAPYVAYLRGCVEELLGDPRAVAKDEWVTAEGRSAVEAFVSGLCPDCLQQAAANVCENCGRPLTLPELLAPRAEPSGSGEFKQLPSGVPTVLSIGAEDLRELRRLHRSITRDDVFIDELVDGLRPHDLTLTLRSEYGFPVGQDRVVNPWIEIFFAHMYALGQILGLPQSCTLDDVRQVVRSREDLRLTYYFGTDNTYYYAAVLPLLAVVFGLPGAVPVALKTNRFLRLGGRKISSSRNNAVWAADFGTSVPVRSARSALARSCPEYGERDFVPPDEADEADQRDWAVGRTEFPVATTPAGRAFAAALERLAAPERFTVRDVLNRLTRARDAIDSGRLSAAEAAELARMADAVESHLLL
ncbi:class I tRNA ligase family protein [Kitasatospora viridis]|uniref:Methionyl-tRNA synthetase n=1 Tax=Kitasatospora viridis TaxID=281105 RepID=A0A561UCS1_9ACTN|nr:class I tRNA ligase family protein [Kitasatospora viridis]TWF97150.1 methionyl-tRNA synthetase [Kitasatospora viridis]